MSVKYEFQIYAECDVCGQYELTSASTLKGFTKILRDTGWKIGKTCICPNCCNKKRDDK